MSTTITTRTPLPKWITSAYNKTNPTVDSITRELSATKVTDITQVKVGRFYLAKMPWYGRKYDEVIREMIAKAKKDQTIMDKINENKKKKDEYNRQYNKVQDDYDEQYYQCLFADDYAKYLELQK
jgi:DNA repair ATPase RecN